MIVTDMGTDNDYETPEAGTYAGRCIRLVDVGTRDNEWKGEIKKQRQVRITWEISEKMSDGKPFVVADSFTLNIGEKSNLGKILNSWRGKPFTDEEKKGFDLSTIIGISGLVSVSYRESKGKQYQNIKSVLQLPKGMTVEDQYNDSFLFDIEDIHDVEKLKKLWGLERWQIERSDEFVAAELTMPDRPKKDEAEKDDDDDLEDSPAF